MSLIHWWPLNGDTKDYGVGNATVTVSGTVTFDNNGKIGKCLSGGDLIMPATATSEVFNKDAVSIAFWFYNGSTTGACIFGTEGMTAPNNRRFSLFQYPTANDLHWSWQNEDSNSTFTGGVASGVIPSNAWSHICAVWNNGNAIMYVNGVQVASSSGVCTSTNWSYDTVITRASSTRKYNDIRIYNHALSLKEVKELSKGLVLHYNFECAELSKNLATTMLPTEAALYTKTNYVAVATSTTNFGLSVGDTYCWSVYVRVPTDQKTLRARVQFYNSGSDRKGPTGSTSVTNGEGLIYVTGTVVSGYAEMQLLIDFNASIDVTTTNIPCYYKCGKLEKGITTPTAWTSSNETPIVYDNSGYGHNGIVNGNLQISTDTGIGKYSAIFNGTDTGVQTPDLSSLIHDGNFTITQWFLHTDEYGSKTWETLYGGPSGFEIESKLQSTASPTFVAYNWGGSASEDQRFIYTINKWHQYAMVRTTTGTTWYMDGVQIFTGSAGTIPSGDYFIGAWKTSAQQNFKGRIADFKIYATALSANDIKAEYQRKASIDKNGNLYTSNFEETAENFLTTENLYAGRVHTSYTSSVGEIVTRNGYYAYKLGPVAYWSGDKATSANICKNQFESGQYIFDLWIDVDDIYYDGISNWVPGGLVVRYTDGTEDTVAADAVSTQGHSGYQHVLVKSNANKTISGLGVYYYIGTPSYIRCDSIICKADNSAKVKKNYTISGGQFIEASVSNQNCKIKRYGASVNELKEV